MTLPCRNEQSVLRAQYVAGLPRGSHVHIIGICGVGTSAVTALLKNLGFRVTGSDKAFYPPMGSYVRRLADKIYEGYSPDNLTERPDLVVIGNSIWRNNPEALHAIELGIPYASMPEIFEGLLIGSRQQCATSVVVAGTHGKTTTSAAIATMLDAVGRQPGYFVGGMLHELPDNIRQVSQELPVSKRVVVLEGDEYDSAFFAKWPKFHSYRPDIAILTSLEFDHGDIFESLDVIATEFERLIERVPAGGHILVYDDVPRLAEVVASVREKGVLRASLWLYGEKPDSPFRIVSREVNGQTQKLSLLLQGEPCEVVSSVTGPQNALNCLAAAAVGKLVGLTNEEVSKGLATFTGVARRQSIVAEIDGITVIDDFAHHPTAIRLTLQGLRESYPQRRILVAYEPRTNTSRRAFFQNDYAQSFIPVDIAIIAQLHDASGTYNNTGGAIESLDVDKLIADVEANGTQALCLKHVDEVKGYLLEQARPGDVIVLMSNGDFDKLQPALIQELRLRSQKVQA